MAKYADMTETQKKEAFDKYLVSRESRSQYSEARRKAGTRLQKAHQDEFNKFLAEEKSATAGIPKSGKRVK